MATDNEPVARRNLLRMGGIAAAGAAAAAVVTAVNASPAGADPVYMQLGVDNNAGTAFTVLEATPPDGIPALLVGNDDGVGLYAYGADAGVFASTRGFGPALDATDQDSFQTGSGTGSAIHAHLDNPNNTSPAIDASTTAWGKAIDAHINHALNPSGAVAATTNGTGPALIGNISNAANSSACITAETAGTGPAVEGRALGGGPAVRATGRSVQAHAGVGAGNGAALDVQGTSTFSRSGVVMIAAGLSSVVSALVPGGLASGSHVLATLQTNAGGVAVRAAVPILSGADTGKIHVYLTAKAPAGGVKVAWLVIG